MDAFRSAVQLSSIQWGGRFNPIIPVGDEAFAEKLIGLFRVDALLALSDSDAVRAFVAKQKHLPWPFFHGGIFTGRGDDIRCQVVDLHHPIAKLYDEPVRNNPDQALPVDLVEWDAADPLADVFLATHGGVPPSDVAGLDYFGLVRSQLMTRRVVIPLDGEVPPRERGAMGFSYLNRAYVRQHYTVQNYRDGAGFYVGRADSFDDLVTFWNLRACDVPVLFCDERYGARTEQMRWIT